MSKTKEVTIWYGDVEYVQDVFQGCLGRLIRPRLCPVRHTVTGRIISSKGAFITIDDGHGYKNIIRIPKSSIFKIEE